MKFILLLVVIVVIVVAARMLMAGRRTTAPVTPSATTPSETTPSTTETGGAIKGDHASKTYYTSDSPDFDRMPSEVWFESEEAAKIAGFTRWDQMR